jgi:hypothetical protein
MQRLFQRKISSFARQSHFVRRWFVPVWCILGVSKALIFTVSFRRLAPYLGKDSGVTMWIPLLSSSQEVRAQQIGRTIRLAARYTPWNSNCFPQAVAARLLLSLYRIPYALYFGLMRDSESGEFKAHAWVVAGRVPVTGGISFGHYTVVSCFVSPQLAET